MKRAAARHILVKTEQLCQQIKDRIEAGEEFGQLAKEHSTCTSKVHGGALGSFSRGQMVAEFDEVVFSAQLNTVQGPVKTQFGYHLVEVTARND